MRRLLQSIVIMTEHNMQLVKTHHESGRGIHAKSVVVNPKEHLTEAQEMVEWFEATNGNFAGENPRAYAIAHCQVSESETPMKLIVLDTQLVKPDADKEGKMSLKNVYFESQCIWNAEILEKPRKVTIQAPQRKVTKGDKKGEVKVDIEMVDREVDNVYSVMEGCMSYPHRKGKRMVRNHRIKVRYQYLTKTLGITHTKTFEGWVEGLKAHILQHEVDHFNGVTMYFKR